MIGHSTPQNKHDSTGVLNDLELILLDETAEPKALPLSLLRKITNDFSVDRRIGTGGFTTAYKGILKNGLVTVKRIHATYSVDDEELHQQIKCLRKVKHKNIVRFLGYCVETDGKMTSYNGKFVMGVQDRLLCFEYLPKGSLFNYITDGSSGLQWRTRYQIIKGICQGLHYLHASHIIHMELNPSNILLDDSMVPKIDGFDISRCLYKDETILHTKPIHGTWGYMAPECIRSSLITIKSDIYSLGLIILQIVSGKKYHHDVDVDAVLETWRTRLDESSKDIKQIRICTYIALECCEPDPMKRPSTQHIINRLAKETTDEVKCYLFVTSVGRY